ncbi:hypothetical protein [Streptomyces sp. NRRL B-24484]|uniref:hypothetical protein n=1 Tax=Streptomyces sp. NRRL B-24484 TaxID=1463833 RepID=UPI0004BF00F9|nr:hypothetical protein [Streptomyces sp. NRRL B-24484]
MRNGSGEAPADRVVQLRHALFAVGDRPGRGAGGEDAAGRPPLAAVSDLPVRRAMELLGSVADGRLVHSGGDLPPLRAAGHVIEDGHLVLRVRPLPGRPADAAVPNWLSYRSESVDEDGLAGWVVTAAGPAREIAAAAERARPRGSAGVGTGEGERLVRIRINQIVGHRLDFRTPR